MQAPSAKYEILPLLESSLCFKMCDGPVDSLVVMFSALRSVKKFCCCVNLNISCHCLLGEHLIGTQLCQCQCCLKEYSLNGCWCSSPPDNRLCSHLFVHCLTVSSLCFILTSLNTP